MKLDVVVIGGGLVGSSIGYHLAARGASALLLDRVDRGRASDAAAGIVSAETYSGESDAWSALALAASRHYPELIGELGSTTAEEPAYGRCGMLIVAQDDVEVERFEAMLGQIRRRQREGALPDDDELREIDRDRARELLPELAEPRRAFYSARAARVDGRQLNRALVRAGRGKGLVCRAAAVDGLSVEAGRVTAVHSGGESIEAEQFVIAGGAWSAAMAEQLGFALPVAPQRGQLVHLSASKLACGSWPMVEGFRGHYLVPWADGHVVAGATRETGSGFALDPTPEGLRQVLDEAVRLVPALNRGALIEVRVGLRPLSADGLPILGRLPGVANMVVATGHGPHGLHLGPYSGKLIADLLQGESVAELAPFSPGRFRQAE